MIVYSVEPWSKLRPDLEKIIGRHWQEIALNKDAVPLDPAWDKYAELAENKSLHCVSARVNDELIGYHLSIITPHLHYKSTLHGITDIYYLLPEHRKGYTGVDLFRYVEDTLRERGVKILVTATKKHLDLTPVFLRLRYVAVETVFKKVL